MNFAGNLHKDRVNDIVFHPQHNTLVTIGSDGRYSMWDKDARTKLKTSDAAPLPLTCAAIHASGQVMAYAIGYDWSRVSVVLKVELRRGRRVGEGWRDHVSLSRLALEYIQH
ncbi:hypothetical protein ANCCAN_00696 [Ancylostoma caninum]|uniref:WD domain, G-beta repeat protein n=1 Tax=Ancylostoma caninum TaxID=29170 RepID=A0A368H963_ANCCA|nr:hypothetical protein ANCCAN_00696 [Ancylostoma caninum]